MYQCDDCQQSFWRYHCCRNRACPKCHGTQTRQWLHAHAWRPERLPGVEFLRRFLQHVLPQGFHKVRYYGLWHPSKRTQSNRAWGLLILQPSTDTSEPPK
jgi:hypothetical protein